MSTADQISYGAYLGLPGWRWSSLWAARRLGPREGLRRHLGGGPGSTRSQQALQAVHAAVLQPEHFSAWYAPYPRTRRGKAYDAWCACRPGVTALRPAEHDRALWVAEAVREHPVAGPMIERARTEVSLTWHDEASGLPCKGRADAIVDDVVADLKVAGTIDPMRIAAMAARLGWHGQLAHYAAGAELSAACLIAVDDRPTRPEVAVYQLDAAPPDGALAMGRALRRDLLHQIADLVARHGDRDPTEWPVVAPIARPLVLPRWAQPDEDLEVS